MRTLILLIYFFRVCLFLPVYGEYGDAGHEFFELEDKSGNGGEMNGTLQNIVKKYYCSADNVSDEKTILYGTKSWSFPVQDVNLTLSYPTANADNQSEPEYLITGLLVILYIDGPQSRGFINSGGILQDRISMTFLMQSITRLSYQFWLYGVSKSSGNVSEYSAPYNLC